MPYFEHVVGVAMILDRLGFGEEVVIAGLLHDVVEDTAATFDDVRDRFGDEVAGIVRHCSEVKTDAQGQAPLDRPQARPPRRTGRRADVRPHRDPSRQAAQPRQHRLRPPRRPARLAALQRRSGQVLWYYRTSIETFGTGDPKLEALADEGRRVLGEVEALGGEGG